MAAQPQQRPLAPHLQIYRPQITSVLSILHRATGAFLAVVLVLLVWWLVALAAGPEAFETAHGFMGSWLGGLVLLGATFAFWYHFAAGIRHLAWDLGYGYDIGTVYKTGYAVIGISIGLTLLTYLFALLGAGGEG
jgi:succinate dehydrogenase / fumarate reductase, cytochrome b subunit